MSRWHMRRPSRPLIVLLALIAAAVGAGSRARAEKPDGDHPPTARLPEKILSGYTGYRLNRDALDRTIRDVLDPMAAAKFNAVDFKIFPRRLDLSPGGEPYERLKNLSRACRRRGLTLLTYVYSTRSSGERDPEKDADLPAFVDERGRTIRNRFSLIHWKTWRRLFDNAFELAEVSRELGIAAVRFDLEALQATAASYDDGAWARFAGDHDVKRGVAAEGRKQALKRAGLAGAYEKWYFKQLAAIARRMERELHEINPDLSLGVMPAKLSHRFYRPFIVELGTERAPAIADVWSMYNGGGFTRRIIEQRDRYKRASEHLRFVPWFRISNYRPGEVPHQAYHAAMATDGYSSWNMRMLRPGGVDRAAYRLPRGAEPGGYFAAYKQANERVRRALAEGRSGGEGIAFKPVDPLPAPLHLEGLKVPQLKPAGSGEGEPRELMLREQQVIDLWAERGEPLRADIRHAAGGRNDALRYALLDADETVLARGTVGPGTTKELSVPAPRTGAYALAVAGRTGGGSWYGVRMHNRHAGVRMDPRAYLFRAGQEVWVARSDPGEPASVRVRAKGSRQRFRVVLDKSTQETGRTKEAIRLPLPEKSKVHELQLRTPRRGMKGFYTKDFRVGVKGAVEPYLFDGPERRVKAVSGEKEEGT